MDKRRFSIPNSQGLFYPYIQPHIYMYIDICVDVRISDMLLSIIVHGPHLYRSI